MRYFLTGATGFIGRRLAAKLREAGHDVVALVREPSRAQDLREIGCELRQGDICDAESMRGPMKGVDGVFHLAAWYRIGVDEPEVARRVNVTGTRNVLTLLRELKIPRGVYTSTIAVFSDTRGQLVDEGYRYDGPMLNLYERTKHEAHYDVALPMIREGLPLVVVMPSVVYGPGDPSEIGKTLQLYLQRKLPVIPKGTAYGWAYVDDVVDGHVAAMDRGRLGESYLLAGPAHTLAEVMKVAERITSIPGPRMQAPAAVLRVAAKAAGVLERFVDLPTTYRAETLRTSAGVTAIGSSAKARDELGWQPRPLEIGLAQTLTEMTDSSRAGK